MSRRAMGARRGGALRVPQSSGLLVPYTISGLVYWLDPERYADPTAPWTLNGTKVASAPSRESAAGVIDATKTAVQGTDANRPTLNVADGAYNGRNTLSFTGASTVQALQSGAWTTSLTQPAIIYAVCSGTNKSVQRVAVDGIGASNRNAVYYNSSGNAAIFAGSVLASSTAVDNGTGRVWAAVFNGASSALYLNNSSSSSASGNANTNTLTGITVGADINGAASVQAWNGKIAAILVYSGIHTAAQRALIMQWLGSRYGITVT